MDALDAGHPLIVLVGDYGVGKRRLAKELYHRKLSIYTDDTLEIDLSDGTVGRKAVLTELVHRGHIPQDVSFAEECAAFLTSPAAPKLVLITCADSEQLIEQVNRMVPPTTRSTVVVTSTMHIEGGHTIRVPPMTDDEALSFARSLIENVEDNELKALILVSGNKPSVIEDACRELAENSDRRIADIVRDLRLQPALFFELAEPDRKKRATTYYANVLDELRVEQPTAALLLETLTLFNVPDIELDNVTALFGVFLKSSDATLQRVVLNEMLQRLEARSLVVSNSLDVRINAITQAILRNIVEDRPWHSVGGKRTNKLFGRSGYILRDRANDWLDARIAACLERQDKNSLEELRSLRETLIASPGTRYPTMPSVVPPPKTVGSGTSPGWSWPVLWRRSRPKPSYPVLGRRRNRLPDILTTPTVQFILNVERLLTDLDAVNATLFEDDQG